MALPTLLPLSIKHAIRNNIVLKCMAFILGFLLWLFISSLHKTTLWAEVPICFYNQHDNMIINAPNTIQIQLSGYRTHIRKIDLNQLAVHIDAQKLKIGKNPLIIKDHNLFLPDLISVVNYSPLNGCVDTYIEKTHIEQCTH